MLKNNKLNYFKFTNNFSPVLNVNLSLYEHVEELRQRVIHVMGIISFTSICSLINVKLIVKILQLAVQNVRFLQLNPGEYFLTTIKLSFYLGILFAIPFILSQLLFFLVPGLNNNEKSFFIPLLMTSVVLFFGGLSFSYFILIPAALSFFIQYSMDNIEPFLSFNEYFDFIIIIFYTTGLSFQLPILQIIFGKAGFLTGKQMLALWKYVILLSTVIGAVLTPSTDPLTQILLSGAIILLYFLGVSIVLILEKNTYNKTNITF